MAAWCCCCWRRCDAAQAQARSLQASANTRSCWLPCLGAQTIFLPPPTAISRGSTSICQGRRPTLASKQSLSNRCWPIFCLQLLPSSIQSGKLLPPAPLHLHDPNPTTRTRILASSILAIHKSSRERPPQEAPPPTTTPNPARPVPLSTSHPRRARDKCRAASHDTPRPIRVPPRLLPSARCSTRHQNPVSSSVLLHLVELGPGSSPRQKDTHIPPTHHARLCSCPRNTQLDITQGKVLGETETHARDWGFHGCLDLWASCRCRRPVPGGSILHSPTRLSCFPPMQA